MEDYDEYYIMCLFLVGFVSSVCDCYGCSCFGYVVLGRSGFVIGVVV